LVVSKIFQSRSSQGGIPYQTIAKGEKGTS